MITAKKVNSKNYTILVNRNFLLQKNYVPSNLICTDIPFDAKKDNPKRLLECEAAHAVKKLFLRAQQDGLALYGISGYRSYDRQAELFSKSSSGFVAPPGASEHQTGLALDVSCPCLHMELSQEFEATHEGQWLVKHAPLYGFILRYPKGKEDITGFPYEPWHIRYVTRPLSAYLSLTGQTLEEYHELSHFFQ